MPLTVVVLPLFRCAQDKLEYVAGVIGKIGFTVAIATFIALLIQ